MMHSVFENCTLPDSGSLIKEVVVMPPLMLLWRIGLVALISSLRSCSNCVTVAGNFMRPAGGWVPAIQWCLEGVHMYILPAVDCLLMPDVTTSSINLNITAGYEQPP
jgi:hypothetical protein